MTQAMPVLLITNQIRSMGQTIKVELFEDHASLGFD
jgi:hypothetical protein